MKQQLKYDKIKKGDSMFCPKCKIENKDNFCIKCGYMLNKEIEVQINYKEQGKKEKETHKLKAYIGKDNHKILNEISVYVTHMENFVDELLTIFTKKME